MEPLQRCSHIELYLTPFAPHCLPVVDIKNWLFRARQGNNSKNAANTRRCFLIVRILTRIENVDEIVNALKSVRKLLASKN